MKIAGYTVNHFFLPAEKEQHYHRQCAWNTNMLCLIENNRRFPEIDRTLHIVRYITLDEANQYTCYHCQDKLSNPADFQFNDAENFSVAHLKYFDLCTKIKVEETKGRTYNMYVKEQKKLAHAKQLLYDTEVVFGSKNDIATGFAILARYDEDLRVAFEHDICYVGDVNTLALLLTEKELITLGKGGWFIDEDAFAHHA